MKKINFIVLDLFQIKFNVTEHGQYSIIECLGIGYENEFF